MLVAVLAWCAAPAAAAPPCAGADIYIAAHADDTLLFQSPDLLEDVQGNRCVQTVFTTAGDAGKGAKYWEGREAGAEAAYAQMAEVANVWQGSTVNLAGKSIHKERLVARPGITILYLRLPDGGEEGKGFPLYGEQSLLKLWRSVNGGSPAISEIEADDESAEYTYSQLVATLTAAIQSFGTHEVRTQNYAQSLPGPDHADHVITGRFAKAAAEALPPGYGGWRLLPYQGYEISFAPQNVFEPLLGPKQEAFATYAPFDEECEEPGGKQCESTTYQGWLKRQYVEDPAVVIKGVVADAGLERTAAASSPASLDGGASSGELPGPLGYSWTQVGGPAVTLTGAATATPSFVTPPHPTVLSFALTVNQGVVVSAPDFVRVRVPSASSNPTAVVGPDQSVGAGARVTLDGSASWDPESLPLTYAWAQVGGPAVALGGAATSAPSFTAPSGPASTLTFSLVVSNGAQPSAPATVRVAVAAAPTPPGGQPGKPNDDGKPKDEPKGETRGALSRRQVQLRAGRRARHVVVAAGGAPAQSCRGRLPVGALCRISSVGNVVVEARRSLTRAGTFHLTVRFALEANPNRRPLKVVIKPAQN